MDERVAAVSDADTRVVNCRTHSRYLTFQPDIAHPSQRRFAILKSRMSAAESHESVGATIADRYRVEALLGRGGMASVYRVRDTKTERMLALKRSYAPTAALLLKRRAVLEREYHTLAQLAHPRDHRSLRLRRRRPRARSTRWSCSTAPA